MSDEQYTPSGAEMMVAWHRHATAEDAKRGRLRGDGESTTGEFVRFLARARRDAVREALDGLADYIDARSSWIAGYEPRSPKAREVLAYRDTHYPEERA